ncbi:MAG TPA: CocE/NonD family hydrolase [Actinomycetota bacterium]|nr:CocE/NonD family hydrolase [Actinomycetota bacterium]
MFSKWRLVALFFLVASLVPLTASAAPTVTSGFITSFDGTQIKYNLFLPDGASSTNQVPVILRTHGWGGVGETTIGGTLAKLLANGYAVLTWDQRGFGKSGGQIEIDHRDYEAKDVASLIDFASSRPEILLEAAGDPVVGMTGGSYAGGIQLASASIDSRIDAIAPEIAWNHLPQSLFPNGVPKVGWDTLLYATGHSTRLQQERTPANYNPMIHRAQLQTTATNDPAPFFSFFDERSPRHYTDDITTPTLVIQGSIDTLFTMNQGVSNFLQIGDNAGGTVPTKLLLYNTGHQIGTAVPIGTGADNARTRADNAILSWFAKYLKGQPVDTGPKVEFQNNFGQWDSAISWPVGGTTSANGTISNLSVTGAPVGGQVVNGNANGSTVSNPLARTNVFSATTNTRVVGVPHISGTVNGAATGAFLFFKLINTATNEVLSDQVTAYHVAGPVLPGQPATFDIDLEGVSYLLTAGQSVALEISTGSPMFTSYRGSGVVDVTFNLSLPTG